MSFIEGGKHKVRAAIVALALVPAAFAGCDSQPSTTLNVPVNRATTGEVCAANGPITAASSIYGETGQITVINVGNPLPDTASATISAAASAKLTCESYPISSTDPAGSLATATRRVVSEEEFP